SEAYTFVVDNGPPGCVGGDFILPSDGKLVIAGKGEITLAISGHPDCLVPALNVLKANQPFTITGGTGAYVGASGTGMLEHDLNPSGTGSVGRDTWVCTLTVPGLDFDLTPPTIRGAVSK